MKAIKVNIEKPCHEDWSRMKIQADQTRHCSACRKNLVDFSKMSDSEIVLWFEKHKHEATCGSWDIGQLNRLLILPTPTSPTSKWKKALSYLIVAISCIFTKTSKATLNNQIVTIEQTPISESDSVKPNKQAYIRGHLSYADKVNAIGVIVGIADSEFETVTDSLGNFEFKIYDGMHIPSIKFTFKSDYLMETTQKIIDFNISNRQYYKLEASAPRTIMGITVYRKLEPIKDERPLLERLWIKLNWW